MNEIFDDSEFSRYEAWYGGAMDMAIEALSAERTGEWLHEELIPNTVEGHVHGECSACHAVRIVDNYCPNCGAKME